MKAVNPYLNFAGNTEEAFDFYRSVFGGEFLGVMRFRDFGGNSMGVPDEDLDKIAHIALPLGQVGILMGTDSLASQGQSLTFGDNTHVLLDTDTVAEAEELFGALSEGGHVVMPLQGTEWAERYGALKDRFGVQWMVNYTGNAGTPDASGG